MVCMTIRSHVFRRIGSLQNPSISSAGVFPQRRSRPDVLKDWVRCAVAPASPPGNLQTEPQYDTQLRTSNLPSPRIFADFTIYRSKAAATFKVLSPTFNGDVNTGFLTLSKQGSLLIEFASALESSGTAPGERRYDWQHKQNFALSATELAGLCEAVEHRAELRFVHDPNMLSASKGQVIKTLSIAPMQPGGDFYLSLLVKEQGTEARVGTSVNNSELAVLKILSVTVIPHLLGMDQVMSQAPNIKDSAPMGANGAPF